MIEELGEALATYQRANAVLLATREDEVVEEQSKTELFINTTLHDKPWNIGFKYLTLWHWGEKKAAITSRLSLLRNSEVLGLRFWILCWNIFVFVTFHVVSFYCVHVIEHCTLVQEFTKCSKAMNILRFLPVNRLTLRIRLQTVFMKKIKRWSSQHICICFFVFPYWSIHR